MGRRRRTVAAAITALVTAGGLYWGATTGTGGGTPDQVSPPPFYTGSFINDYVGDISDAAYVADSVESGIRNCLLTTNAACTTGTASKNLLAGEFAVSIYDSHEHDTFIGAVGSRTWCNVYACTDSAANRKWGCEAATYDGQVKVRQGAAVPTGSDQMVVTVDWTNLVAYEMYHAAWDGTTWQSDACNVVGIDPADSAADGNATDMTGNGFARLAGVARIQEFRNAVDDGTYTIPHALVFSTNINCAGDFQFPATKTDATNLRGVPDPGSGSGACITEGMRIRLAQSYTCPTTSGLYVRIICETLKDYGAYDIDNGGGSTTSISIIAEYASGYGEPQAWWRGYGCGSTLSGYCSLNAINWSNLQVFDQWCGAASC